MHFCLPDEESDPELYNLVNKFQIHSHSATCCKYKNIPCRFSFGKYFTERTICAEPLASSDMDELEKEKILSFQYQSQKNTLMSSLICINLVSMAT